MHCYERTTPVTYNNFTDKDHFSTDGKMYKHNATETEWSQTRNQKYGFGKRFIYNKTHLEFK